MNATELNYVEYKSAIHKTKQKFLQKKEADESQLLLELSDQLSKSEKKTDVKNLKRQLFLPTGKKAVVFAGVIRRNICIQFNQLFCCSFRQQKTLVTSLDVFIHQLPRKI